MAVETTSSSSPDRPVGEAIWKGLQCRCPKCGDGRLFDKWLKVTPQCTECGEELHHEQAQDFPPYITISIVGHVILTLVLVVRAYVDISLTTHMLIWIPLSGLMTLAIMQPVKGGVVGLQWALRMFGFGEETEG